MWKSVHCMSNEFCGKRAEKPQFLLSRCHISDKFLWNFMCVSVCLLQTLREEEHVCGCSVPVAVQALQRWGFTCGFSRFRAGLRVGGVSLCWGILFSISWVDIWAALRASEPRSVCQYASGTLYSFFFFFFLWALGYCLQERGDEERRRKVNRGHKGRGGRRWAQEISWRRGES